MIKMRVLLSILSLMLIGVGNTQFVNAADSGEKMNVYDFTVKDIDGNDVSLGTYKGKVLMIVNVASKCGYTPQYEGLQSIYEKYSEQGFVILGFPANNFGHQEPGTNVEIKQFCTTKFDVSFPMFSKISVKGENQAPLYQYLTSEETDREFSGDITWNFNKFLIGQGGKILNRFASADAPQSDKVVQAIEKALAQ